MERSYFAVRYRLDNQDRYLIWYNDARSGNGGDWDGVVVDADGHIPVFRTPEALASYAQSSDIEVDSEDPAFYNLDIIAKWLKVKRPKWHGPTALPCVEFLGAWNLFMDVSRSIDGSFDPDREKTRKVYSKIFWGNNIPALTPEGEHYVPYFPKHEITTIRDIMTDGLRMFRSCIRRQ